jgi:hypothetical protein
LYDVGLPFGVTTGVYVLVSGNVSTQVAELEYGLPQGSV